ncbi:MAG: SapC family protein, partial [Parvularculaceae bacterium]|nr:SapC family protein [Parvularculaceae bacterium]
ETDRRLTDQIVEQLKKYDIIQGQTAQYTPQGDSEPRPFANYFGVDEAKLQALTDEQFLELRKMNVLPILYAHMISLANWRTLISRRMERLNVTEVEAVSGQRLS